MSQILDCTSEPDREKLESNNGTQFSVLVELSYFDTVRMTIVDPMDNLYLGTAKIFWKYRNNRVIYKKVI